MDLFFQSSELDSLQELFELLQIKSDMWQSSTTEEAKVHSEDDSSWTATENENSEQLLVKHESDDDEKEEGEIKDDDDDTVDERSIAEQNSGSPNPVNLSLNPKSSSIQDKDIDQENSSEVSQLPSVNLEKKQKIHTNCNALTNKALFLLSSKLKYPSGRPFRIFLALTNRGILIALLKV